MYLRQSKFNILAEIANDQTYRDIVNELRYIASVVFFCRGGH